MMNGPVKLLVYTRTVCMSTHINFRISIGTIKEINTRKKFQNSLHIEEEFWCYVGVNEWMRLVLNSDDTP